MCVVFGLHGQTKVEDVGDSGHINAACCYVGGHQDLNLAIAQSHQAAIAQTLTQSTVQGNGIEAILLQVCCQTIALNLRAGKHNGLIDRCITQPMIEQFALVLCVVGPEQNLLDVAVFFLGRIDLDFLNRRTTIVHHAHGQLLNAWRKGSAEHHGLLALAGELVDVSQVVREAQVQHTVGFVNHQEFDFVEFDLHGALQVEQTTWRGHHQVGILQLGNLQLVRHAAHNVGHAQAAAMLHQIDGVVSHLLGQFACRANNQGTR